MSRGVALGRQELITAPERADYVRHPHEGSYSHATTVHRPSDSEEWLYDATIRIKEFGLLPLGWDTYGAPQVSSSAIAQATRMLRAFADSDWRPFIGPTSDGGIQFEWLREEAEFSITILDDASVEVFYALPDGREWWGPLGEEPHDLNDIYSAIRQVAIR